MKSEVYFAPIDNSKHTTQLKKIEKLIEKCNIKDKFSNNQLIALKVHFGELGNTTFTRHIYLRPIIERLKGIGAKPYLTDTNTLYVGMRSNSADHILNASYNGFNLGSLQIPVIIGDGLRGEYSIDFEVNLENCKTVKLGGNIINADGMVVVSHFKAHEVAGFGGAIKNISMGCASRGGKLEMHSSSNPTVNQEICTACSKCTKHCQVNAIEVKEKAFITDKCVGCIVCSSVCPEGAIDVNWNQTYKKAQEMMVEYAYGIDKAFNSNIIYINFLTEMTPACDCYPGSQKSIAEDIGFLASTDPVAIDKASYDLVVKEAGEKVFTDIYPYLDPKHQFNYADKIKFGSADYELILI